MENKSPRYIVKGKGKNRHTKLTSNAQRSKRAQIKPDISSGSDEDVSMNEEVIQSIKGGKVKDEYEKLRHEMEQLIKEPLDSDVDMETELDVPQGTDKHNEIDEERDAESKISTPADVSDGQDMSTLEYQEKIQMAMPALTKILTIPLVPLDISKLVRSSRNKGSFCVGRPQSSLSITSNSGIYMFDGEVVRPVVVKEEVKEEAIEGTAADNSEPEAQSPAQEQTREQSPNIRVISNGTWANSSPRQKTPRKRPAAAPAAPRDDVNVFLHTVGEQLRDMPADDSLELQGQIRQLVQARKLMILQRNAKDLQLTDRRPRPIPPANNNGKNGRKQNSTIIYMKYERSDDESEIEQENEE